MNIPTADHGRNPFTAISTAEAKQAQDENVRHPVSAPLPEGWRRLATGLRGTRLYRVPPTGRADVHWVAEMTINGNTLGRRFATELHARAWLTTVNEPRSSAIPFDLEELNGPIRAAFVAALGRGFNHPA